MGSVTIFLDVDGVLLPVAPMAFGGGDLDDSCLRYFKEITTACGGVQATTVVLSSTWRNSPEKVERLAKALEAIQGPRIHSGVPNGVPNPKQVTYLRSNPSEQMLIRDRVDEIYFWIDAHRDDVPWAAAGRWFAIDDMNLGIDPRMEGHFLKTDVEEGITRSNVTEAIKIIEKLPNWNHNVSEYYEQQKELPLQVELQGKVKRYNPTRGFGFITCDGVDVFVHHSCILHEGFRALNVGATVSFKVGLSGNRRQAFDVRQVSQYVPPQYSTSMAPPLPYSQFNPLMQMVPQGNGWRAPNDTVYYLLQSPQNVPQNFGVGNSADAGISQQWQRITPPYFHREEH